MIELKNKRIRIPILLLLLISFSIGRIAFAEVLRVDGNQVALRLNGKHVSIGERLDVIGSDKEIRALIRITDFNNDTASAEVESGTPSVGMKVARHARVIVERETLNSKYSYNFRLNPIGLIGGAIAANFDFKISDEWTIGLQGAYLHVSLSPSGIFTSNYEISAWGVGPRANLFFNGAFKNGFYFGPSIVYLDVTLKTSNANGPAIGKASGAMASGLIGYGWFAQGFNLMLGGGYASVLGASGITIKDAVGNKQTISANLSGLTYELSAGYAF